MTNTLKPCPFCGGTIKAKRGYRGITCFICNGCMAIVSLGGDKVVDHRATEAADPYAAWNRRPPARALTLDELRGMEGKPVFTRTIGVLGSGRWELVSCGEHWTYLKTAAENYKMTNDELVSSYGKAWVAYDSEPDAD